MRYKRLLWNILAGILVLIALALFMAAILPFGRIKSLADGLMTDGNFGSLKENNVLIFRILLGSAGSIFITIAVALGFGKLKKIQIWGRRYLSDLVGFVRAIKPKKLDTPTVVILFLILAAAIIFRLVHIYGEMTHDEAYTFIVFGSTTIFNIITNYHLPNNHILNSILINISTHLFGIQPWAVRLPSLLAGLVIIPSTYALARIIYDKYTAILSVLLIAILPGAIQYATQARGYSLVALFTILTLWLANYVRTSKNLFAWSLLILFSALGFYSVPVFLFPFGIVFAWLFFETLFIDPGEYNSRINFLKYWMLAGFCSAVLVLILYTPVFIYSGAAKVFANPWVTPESWTGFIPSIPGHLMSVWQEWTGRFSTVWAFLLLPGFFFGILLHRRITRQYFPLQIAAILWITILILIQRPLGVTKIWVFLQAPFMMWCAAGWMGLLKDLRLGFAQHVPLAAIVTGLAVLLATTNAILEVPGISKSWAVRSPAENTVLAISDQLGPRDLIIVDAPYDASIWYYSRLYDLADSHFDNRLPFEKLFVIVSRTDNQTVESVLETRGPKAFLVDPSDARSVINFQNLDTYQLSQR
jgi:hypothetical protein